MKKLTHLLILVLIPVFAHSQESGLNEYKIQKDVVWASPGGLELTMDIYTPKTGKDTYPVLVIYHGGGWLINNKSIMDQMSQYIVEHGDYVVCNVNYRLLTANNNTTSMNAIVEDAFGALLWIRENIKRYGGDPGNIAVTGDSAGGHLAEMVVVAGDNLSKSGFSEKPLGFNPTYIPKGETIKSIRKKGLMDVQAAIISYGAFDILASGQGDFEKPSNFFWQMGGAQARQIFSDTLNANDNPEYYKAVSPIYNIPDAADRKLPPQLFTVGSKDDLTTPQLVSIYYEKVKAAGHPAAYWVYEGRPHAFLDSGSNQYLGTSFEKDAPDALDKMIAFLDKVFYQK